MPPLTPSSVYLETKSAPNHEVQRCLCDVIDPISGLMETRIVGEISSGHMQRADNLRLYENEATPPRQGLAIGFYAQCLEQFSHNQSCSFLKSQLTKDKAHAIYDYAQFLVLKRFNLVANLDEFWTHFATFSENIHHSTELCASLAEISGKQIAAFTLKNCAHEKKENPKHQGFMVVHALNAHSSAHKTINPLIPPQAPVRHEEADDINIYEVMVFANRRSNQPHLVQLISTDKLNEAFAELITSCTRTYKMSFSHIMLANDVKHISEFIAVANGCKIPVIAEFGAEHPAFQAFTSPHSLNSILDETYAPGLVANTLPLRTHDAEPLGPQANHTSSLFLPWRREQPCYNDAIQYPKRGPTEKNLLKRINNAHKHSPKHHQRHLKMLSSQRNQQRMECFEEYAYANYDSAPYGQIQEDIVTWFGQFKPQIEHLPYPSPDTHLSILHTKAYNIDDKTRVMLFLLRDQNDVSKLHQHWERQVFEEQARIQALINHVPAEEAIATNDCNKEQCGANPSNPVLTTKFSNEIKDEFKGIIEVVGQRAVIDEEAYLYRKNLLGLRVIASQLNRPELLYMVHDLRHYNKYFLTKDDLDFASQHGFSHVLPLINLFAGMIISDIIKTVDQYNSKEDREREYEKEMRESQSNYQDYDEDYADEAYSLDDTAGGTAYDTADPLQILNKLSYWEYLNGLCEIMTQAANGASATTPLAQEALSVIEYESYSRSLDMITNKALAMKNKSSVNEPPHAS